MATISKRSTVVFVPEGLCQVYIRYTKGTKEILRKKVSQGYGMSLKGIGKRSTNY
jgi:hypothetical protein